MTENVKPDNTEDSAGKQTEEPIAEKETHGTEAAVQQSKPAAETGSKEEKHTWRKVAIGFLIFLGAVLLVIANFAFWARFTLTSTNGWIAAVGPITKDPQVANILSTYAVGQIFKDVDVNQAVQEILPDKFDALSGPITASLEDLAIQTANKIIMSDAFNNVWVGINRTAHATIMKVLSGQGDALYMQNGNLTLDLSDVTNFVQDTLGVQNLNLVPQAQDGKIVLFSSKQVAEMQEAYSYIRTFGLLMPLLSFLAFGFAVLISLWRRTTLLWIGVVAAITMALNLIAYWGATSYMFVSITNPMLRDLERAIYDVVTHGYVVQTVFFLILGILIAIGAWQAAPDSWFMTWVAEREQKKAAEEKTSGETAS